MRLLLNARSALILLALVAILTPGSDSKAVPKRIPQYRLEVLPVPADCHSFSTFHGLDDQGRAVGLITCDEFRTYQAPSGKAAS